MDLAKIVSENDFMGALRKINEIEKEPKEPATRGRPKNQAKRRKRKMKKSSRRKNR